MRKNTKKNKSPSLCIRSSAKATMGKLAKHVAIREEEFPEEGPHHKHDFQPSHMIAEKLNSKMPKKLRYSFRINI
tara:strand:+ start:139 stop:363 length:225 start_codon:yes stop_codon:yes gene_type:complete